MITAIQTRLGEPVDLREDICGAKRVVKAKASESDGMDDQGDKGEVKSVLAAKPAAVTAVNVFVGPNPDRESPAPGALALNPLQPMPLPSPLGGSGASGPQDVVRFVDEVRRAVAGHPVPREADTALPDLTINSKVPAADPEPKNKR